MIYIFHLEKNSNYSHLFVQPKQHPMKGCYVLKKGKENMRLSRLNPHNHCPVTDIRIMDYWQSTLIKIVYQQHTSIIRRCRKTSMINIKMIY